MSMMLYYNGENRAQEPKKRKRRKRLEASRRVSGRLGWEKRAGQCSAKGCLGMAKHVLQEMMQDNASAEVMVQPARRGGSGSTFV